MEQSMEQPEEQPVEQPEEQLEEQEIIGLPDQRHPRITAIMEIILDLAQDKRGLEIFSMQNRFRLRNQRGSKKK